MSRGMIGHVDRHKSRKRYRCDWCNEDIEPGDTYCSWLWKDGDLSRVRMHAECFAANTQMHKLDRYFEDWTPGSFTRGCICERGDSGCDHQWVATGKPGRAGEAKENPFSSALEGP